jgi:hypothetical protein
MSKSVLLTSEISSDLEKRNTTLSVEESKKILSNVQNTFMGQKHISEVELMISPCCKGFVDFCDGKFICSCCGQFVKDLGENESFKYKQIYNQNKNIINSELVNRKNNLTKRLAKDPTYMPTTIKCTMCNNYSRLVRDMEGNKIFVCIKCRNVFYS